MRSITIVGSGAIGSLMGAYMVQSGLDVTLVGQWSSHVEALKHNGLPVEGSRGTFSVKPTTIHISELDQLSSPLQTVLVVVKSNQTTEVARTILPYLAKDACVVSVQNGFNEDRLSDVIGRERVLGAIITVSAELLIPGKVIEHTGLGQALLRKNTALTIGEIDGSISNRLSELAENLKPVGEIRITKELFKERRGKTITNCMGNVSEAITGLNSWDTRRNPLIQRLMIHLGSEATQVALALNNCPDKVAGGLDPSILACATIHEESYNLAKDALTAGTTSLPKYPAISSMLQDILRGRVTEIDYLNGLVADKAKEFGIPTPVNNDVIELIKTMETGQIAPDPENVHLIKSIA